MNSQALSTILHRLSPHLCRMTNPRALSTITPNSKCVGCEGIGSTLSPDEVERQRALLIPQWQTNAECTRLMRSIRTKDFVTALDYLNRIGALAEAEGHHPDMGIRMWNWVDVGLWTHSLGGVTENDLIMAVKIDTIPVELAKVVRK